MNLEDRKDGERMLVLGHRGSPLRETENTIPSFLRAIAEGADGVELDVRSTRDDHLVVSHDNNLKRVYGVELKIEESTLEEVRVVAPGIPELHEVFEALGHVYYDIEVKADKVLSFPLSTITLLSSELRAHGELLDRIMVSSFNPFAMRRFASIYGKSLPLGLIYEGNSPFAKHLTNHGQGRVAFPCSFLKPKHDILTSEKKRKPWKTMCPWTVDEAEGIKAAVEAKCPLIITNDPEKAIRELKGYGLR